MLSLTVCFCVCICVWGREGASQVPFRRCHPASKHSTLTHNGGWGSSGATRTENRLVKCVGSTCYKRRKTHNRPWQRPGWRERTEQQRRYDEKHLFFSRSTTSMPLKKKILSPTRTCSPSQHNVFTLWVESSARLPACQMSKCFARQCILGDSWCCSSNWITFVSHF